MKNNKVFVVGVCAVLVLIITVHVALFSKYKNNTASFFNTGIAGTLHPRQWCDQILFMPAKAIPVLVN